MTKLDVPLWFTKSRKFSQATFTMEVQSKSDAVEGVGGREEVDMVSREFEQVSREGEEEGDVERVVRGGEEEGDVERVVREGEEEGDVEQVVRGGEEEGDVERVVREGEEEGDVERVVRDGHTEEELESYPGLGYPKFESEIKFIQAKSGDKLDFADSKKVVLARRIAGRRLQEKRGIAVRKERTNKERKALINHLKKLTAHDEPMKGSKDYTKREKMIVMSVKEAVEKEKKNYTEVVKRGGEYIESHIKKIPVEPFINVKNRTAAMTGVPKSRVAEFSRQYKDCNLTPKKKPGRKAIEPEDWMLSDIRNIITGIFMTFDNSQCIF